MNTVFPTPKVLKWARESSGYSLEEVANKLKRKTIEEQTILDWEKGKAFPSYPQLETLAYKVYKRPLAVFFFPEPPADESLIKKSFRTLPKPIETLTPRMRWILRKAYVMQLNVKELHQDKAFNKQEKKIFKSIRFTPQSSIQAMAKKTRDYLKISVEEQKQWSLESQSSWNIADIALKKWRKIIQSHGVFVFKDSFKESDFSGFCLYDEHFPIIYVNNNESKNRQIFTLFHELAHIFFRTSGFDPKDENHFRTQLKGNNQKIETLCNEFAGAFLVPEESLTKDNLLLSNIELKDIKKLADSYCVSQEVFLIRLLKNNIISNRLYNQFKQSLDITYQKSKSKKTSKGGNYYATKETYLGDKYISLVFKKYHQQQISLAQLADFLGEKIKNASQMDPFKQNKVFE